MKGSWLGCILRKKEVPEKLIQKLVKNWNIEPSVANIDEWAMANLDFPGKWQPMEIVDSPLFAPSKVIGQAKEEHQEVETEKES